MDCLLSVALSAFLCTRFNSLPEVRAPAYRHCVVVLCSVLPVQGAVNCFSKASVVELWFLLLNRFLYYGLQVNQYSQFEVLPGALIDMLVLVCTSRVKPLARAPLLRRHLCQRKPHDWREQCVDTYLTMLLLCRVAGCCWVFSFQSNAVTSLLRRPAAVDSNAITVPLQGLALRAAILVCEMFRLSLGYLSSFMRCSC